MTAHRSVRLGPAHSLTLSMTGFVFDISATGARTGKGLARFTNEGSIT